jgi:hypothetical protein
MQKKYMHLTKALYSEAMCKTFEQTFTKEGNFNNNNINH